MARSRRNEQSPSMSFIARLSLSETENSMDRPCSSSLGLLWKPLAMISWRALVVAFLASLVVPCSRGQLRLIAYDGFNYSNGDSLNGQNGGTGWAGAWVKDYGNSQSLSIRATGLSYSGLSTTGNSATWTSGGFQISEDSRSLPLVNSGVVYIQFLAQFGSSGGGGTPNLRLFSGGTLTGGIGASGGPPASVVSILGTDLNPLSNGNSSTSASLSALNLIVMRIDYGANESRMWINPNLTSFDYSNPGAPNAVYSGLAPAFDSMAFYTRSPGTVDELTVYAVPTVPAVTTPTSASVAASTATLGGNVTSNGGATITAIGIAYSVTSTNSNPRIGDTGVTNATGTGTTGVFTVNVTGLTAGTAYTFAAYATNGVGTAYTSTATFTTVLPPVISNSLAASGTYGSAIRTYAITASNTPTSYNATGLPPGLSINPTNGQITGTPTTAAGSPYGVTISATNAGGTGTATLVFTVNKVLLTVTGITAISKIADGTTTATLNLTGATLNGVFPVDAAGVTLVTSGATSAFADSDVGNGKTVAITGLTLSGTSASNYTITAPTTTASIVAPNISVTVTLGNTIQAYDGSPKSVSVTTNPAGLRTSVAYLASSGAPVNIGTYVVVANVTSSGYNGNAVGSLTVTMGTAIVTLSADNKSATTVPAGLGVTFTFGGAAPVPTAPGTYAVTATVNDPNYTGSTTGTLIIGKFAQSITFGAPGAQLANAGPLSLAATASSGLPVTIAVTSGPAILSGNTLTLTGAAGTVVLDASQPGNNIYAAAPDVVGSFKVTAVGQQIFFGSTGSNDPIAANLNANGTNGTIIGYLAGTKQGFVVNFQLNADGTFTAPAATFTGNTAASSGTGPQTTVAVVHPVAALASTLTFQGRVVNGVISGSIVELALTFGANVQPPTGPSAGVAGYYQATATNTATGNTYSIVGTQSQVYVLAVTPTILATGTATLAANNTFTVQALQNATIAGSIDQSTTTVTGTISVPGQPATNFSGLASTTTRTDRLINLSSRSQVGPTGGANLITGFVIGGPAPKQVLLRAVGPGLASFGFSDIAGNPRLVLFDNTGAIIAQNTGWPTADAPTMNRVGAFPLTPGSADCDIVTTLAPGAYTMQVDGGSGTGLALAEIYDASVNPQAQYQRLVNISSRGTVGADDGVLVGGFVVTGNSPKSVLIRGVGPGLAAFGVQGALIDPKLAIYSGFTIIARNNGWSTPVTLNSAQAAATAAQIASTAQATGAFALTTNSKDSAVIVALTPGAYTAQVSSVSGSTGVALVEVYEVP